MKKIYLGDGAYAEYDGFQMRIYTSNGVEEKNEVFLGPHELEALINFLKVVKE
jgi:hypothetical protein